VASNCCQTVTEEDFALIQDALPILSGRLQHQVCYISALIQYIHLLLLLLLLQ
jgi:hypothetical protein